MKRRRSLLEIVGEPRRTCWRGRSSRHRASNARWWSDGVPGPRDTVIFDAKSGPCYWDVPEVHSIAIKPAYEGIVDVWVECLTVDGPFWSNGGTINFPSIKAGTYWLTSRGAWCPRGAP